MDDDDEDDSSHSSSTALRRRLEEMLRQIPPEYQVVEFNPVPRIVEALSSDRDAVRDSLENYLEVMDEGIDLIVDEYYQGFSKSIKNYSSILAYVTNSQGNTAVLRDDIAKITKYLHSGGRRKALKAMWKQVLEYKAMIRILDKVQELQQVPAKLDGYIQAKYYLHAARLLVDSVAAMFSEDLLEVAALADLRKDLLERKNNFHELLLQELEYHIYVKSPSDDQRTDASRAGGRFDHGGKRGPGRRAANLLMDGNRELKASGQGNEDEELVEDLLQDPQADVRRFMKLILESLQVLDRIPTALASLTNQVSAKVKAIIRDYTLDIRRQIAGSEEPSDSFPSGRPPLKPDAADADSLERVSSSQTPLVMLLQRLFPKYLQILQTHVFLADFVGRKYVSQQQQTQKPAESSRNPLRKTITDSSAGVRKYLSNPYTVDSVWGVMQIELESLLKAHLPASSYESMKDLQKKLNTLLKTTLEGVGVSAAGASAGSQQLEPDTPQLFSFSWSSAATYKVNESMTSSQASWAVIKPSPYNITAVFPHVMQFHNQLQSVLPSAKGGVTRAGLNFFLEDYIMDTFLPHIKIDYNRRFDAALEDANGFTPRIRQQQGGYSSADSSRPLLQSSLEVFQFIQELYVDLTTMPAYTGSFTDIIKGLLDRYQDRCHMLYDETVQNMESARRLDKDYLDFLASDPVFRSLKTGITTSDMLRNPKSPGPGIYTEEDVDDFQERELEIDTPMYLVPEKEKNALAQLGKNVAMGVMLDPALFEKGPQLNKQSCIFDTSKLALLANLHDSLEWLAEKVQGLGYLGSVSGIQDAQRKLQAPTVVQFFGQIQAKVEQSLQQVNIPIAWKMSTDLETLLRRLRSLSELCLFTLRVELRVHCYYFLDAVKKCAYVLDEESREPDFFVLDLNRDLAACDEALQHYLPKHKLRYCFDGLARVMSHALIQNLRKIKNINANGVLKMARNVFALQQNLTNIIQVKEAHFDRVRKYYGLLNLTEDELFQYITMFLSKQLHTEYNATFTFDEYRALVESKHPNRKLPERTAAVLDSLLSKYQRQNPAAAKARAAPRDS